MARQPTFGTTRSGMPVHARTRDNFTEVANFRPRRIRQAVGEVEGFNAKLAVVITSGVGTMACAYVFAAVALVSLPDAIHSGRAALIQWIAQTFLQLVLLSIIMVGQRVQNAASDARAEKSFEDTEKILDRLDLTTAGGLADVMAAVERVGTQVAARPGPPA
jgi:uncharacterized membrane protein